MRLFSSDEGTREIAVERLQIASPALALAAVFLLSSILQALLHGILSAAFPALTGEGWYLQVVSMAPMYLIAMPFSLLLFGMSESAPPVKERLRPAAWWGLLAVCFLLTFAGNYIGALVNHVVSMLTGKPAVNELEQMTMSTPLWSNLLFLGILAPIMEELFFRKLVIDRLRRYGELPAILLSGIAFGLLHGNFSQLFYATTLGVVFGYVYLRTGNILHTITLHMVINLIGGVYATEVYRMVDVALLSADPLAAWNTSIVGVMMYLLYAAFIGVVCIAGVVSAVLLMLHWFRKPRRAEHPLTGSEWVRVLVINPGVWLFFVVIAMLFLL